MGDALTILIEPTWCFVDPQPDEAAVLWDGLAVDVPGAWTSAPSASTVAVNG